MQTKDRLRSIQNREISSIDNKSSEMSGVSKDHVQAVKGILKQMADHFMAETEVVLAHKQKEILGK